MDIQFFLQQRGALGANALEELNGGIEE